MSIPVRFLTVDQIPRNAFGKIDRAGLPELVPGARRV
jgi:hypothetical protein